jgi:hypothetical protein
MAARQSLPSLCFQLGGGSIHRSWFTVAALIPLVVGAGCGGGGSTQPTTAGASSSIAAPPSSAIAPAPGHYTDAAGDVTAGQGPDITAVDISESAGLISIKVTFANTPPLAFSTVPAPGFTDMLLIPITTIGTSTPVDFVAGVHGADLERWVLRRDCATPDCSGGLEKPELMHPGPTVVSERSVTFSFSPQIIGDPTGISFYLAAGREGAEAGQAGDGSDMAPNSGRWQWTRR